MIELSSREKVILKKLLEEVTEDELEFCLVSDRCGKDLSEIEQALIKDILREYMD